MVAVEACGAGWRRPTELNSGALQPRQQVQVWRQGSMTRWHAVVVTWDSISGIPFHRPIDCDSCRTPLPRAGVDSVRLGNPVAAFWKSFGLVMGGFLAMCVAVCPRDAVVALPNKRLTLAARVD